MKQLRRYVFLMLAALAIAAGCAEEGDDPFDSETPETPTTNYKYFVYANSSSARLIGVYELDVASGALTDVQTFDYGTEIGKLGPYILQADPDGSHLAVGHSTTSQGVGVVAVNATTGKLTAVGSAGLPNSQVSVDLAYSRQGNFLFAPEGDFSTGSDGGVNIYSVADEDGAITHSSFFTKTVKFQLDVAAHPTGDLLYVGGQNIISAYSYNSTTGALSFIEDEAMASTVGDIAIHSGGSVLLATSGSKVYSFSISQVDGGLTALDEASIDSTSGVAISFHPTLTEVVYIADYTADKLFTYSLNTTTGAFTEVASALTTSDEPSAIAIDPSGSYMVTANDSGNALQVFSLDETTGAPTLLQTYASGGGDLTTFAHMTSVVIIRKEVE